MNNKMKAVLIGGVGFILFAPIWKTGHERGISTVGALSRHTILYKEAGQIDEIMVEENYLKDFKKVFDGESSPY